ncbi:MAG: rhodanese-related sulfurtransferase [Ignavibacteriales bacterium]
MNQYKILLFYKYVNLTEPEKLVSEHLQWCIANNIKGRVFFADEGVNGTVSGTLNDIEKYKTHLTSYGEFKDLWFKEDFADEHTFKKMHVRLKNEIVSGDLKDISVENSGKKLSPEQLVELFKAEKDFVLVDARNWYESKIGKFRNAITPQIKHFREWKAVVDEDLKDFRNKTVVTYCTGGIRCEKASAYMIERGFSDVYQLDGGIINFVKKFPDSYWEGGLFVFDERRVINPNTKEEVMHIAECHFCKQPTSYYINCHNVDCDKIIVSCHECKIENDYCCSDQCRESNNKRKVYHG